MDGVSWLRSIGSALPIFAADAATEVASSPLALDIILVLALILVNGFFSGAEMAIVTLNDNYVNKMAESGNKIYIRIKRLTDDSGNFLSTIQTGVTFAGFLSSAFAGERFSTRITMALDPNGTMPWLSTLSLVLVTLLTSYLSLIIGELVPKQLAMHNPEKFSAFAVRPVAAFGRMVKPFTAFLNFSTNLVLRLIGIPTQREVKSVTEEEIRMMVDVSTEGGNIEASEKTMITNIFELNDKEVSEIMTHRMNVVALEADTSFSEAVSMAIHEGYTRYPVYDDNIDNIIGILNVKDLMNFYLQEDRDNFDMRNLIREAYYTPETKHVDALFREMQKNHASIAIVIDEYGGVSGIVSMEDLLEEIVGNIQDEYDEELSEIVLNPDGSYTIDGLCELYTLENEIPGFDVPDEDEIDYDTIAGLVLHQLDRIPEENEQPEVWFKNYRFRVLEMDDRRIASVQMWIHELNAESDDDNESSESNGIFKRSNGDSNDVDEEQSASDSSRMDDLGFRRVNSLPIIQSAQSDENGESEMKFLKAETFKPRGHRFLNF